jgi:hypothetical protein
VSKQELNIAEVLRRVTGGIIGMTSQQVLAIKSANFDVQECKAWISRGLIGITVNQMKALCEP